MVELNALANAVVKLYDLVEQIGTVAVTNTKRVLLNSEALDSLSTFTESVGTFVVEFGKATTNSITLLNGIALENMTRLDDLEITLYTLIDKVDLFYFGLLISLGANIISIVGLSVVVSILLNKKSCQCNKDNK